MLRWRRQLYQIQMMATGGAMGLMVLIILYIIAFNQLRGSDQRMMFALVPLITAMLVATYFVMMKRSDVLRSISTLVHIPSGELVQRLEELLGDEGITFTRRSAGPRRSGFKTTFREVLEVGDLRMALFDSRGASVVFLGPVGRENAEEVERLKVVVEKVAEMG